MKKWLIAVLFLLIAVATSCKTQVSYEYANYGMPLESARIFANGVISKADQIEYSPSFSSNLMIFYYAARSNKGKPSIMEVTRSESGDWNEPTAISFSGKAEMEPILSPDGQTLYFSAETEDGDLKPHDLFYAKRGKSGWEEPLPFPDTINSEAVEYFATSTSEGDLYFTREGDGIYRSVWDGEKYLEAEKLEVLQDYYYASHPFISPDGSFLIFDARHQHGLGSADLYITFVDAEGSFGEPCNLGDSINSPAWEAMATLSPDLGTLFFVREDGTEREIYWISFDIETYRYGLQEMD